MFKFHYFNQKFDPGFVALFSGRMIQFAGNELVSLFVPVFIFKFLGYEAHLVFAYFLLGHLAYGLFVPLGTSYLNSYGFRRAIRTSVFFDALYYVCLFLVPLAPAALLALSLLMMLIARTLFWLPYHVDFAKFSDPSDRGKDVSMLWATKALLSIVMPVLAGFLIAAYGFHLVFILAIIIFLLAGIPFLALPHTNERFSWTYGETWRNFCARENRELVVSNMANGAEEAVSLIVWPIFIWQILEGNYLAVGALSSLIVLAGVILQLAAGKAADLWNKRRMLAAGSFIYASGWIIKIFVTTAFEIFLAGAYHALAKIFKDTPFDALNYDILAGRGHYVDECTVLKEMGIQLGKVIVLALAILISLFAGLNWVFALAAVASLLVMLI